MEQRVLILAPRGRDAAVVKAVLEAMPLHCLVCADDVDLLAELGTGAAAAIVTEESLTPRGSQQLDEWLRQQPTWSDFPFIVLATKQARRRSASALASLEMLGNVVLLERPVHADTLAKAAASAVRARARQYAARRHLHDLGVTRQTVEKLNRELEQRILARTRELASANDRLMAEISERERAQAALLQSQKMEALGQLTGGIAHDFNNLLHAVNMSLDIIARRSRDDQVGAIATRAKGVVGRGASLTGQLLSFARRQSLLPRRTDIASLLLGMRELIGVSVGPTITLQMATSLPSAWAVLDANQLEMAILNLAVNARDAMPAGGTLQIRLEQRPRGDADLADGDYLVVSVADTGDGIPPHLLGKVFDPFFTTKPIGSGTGLGLSQVYGFAKQSGGIARLKSRVGEGTTVEMYFPAAVGDDVIAEPAAPCSALPASGMKRRILVVEDDADVRRVIVESLALIGYDVNDAASGESGLAAVGAAPPDLLIVDYAMPDMNGADFILQARERFGNLPVILATGYADMAAVGQVLGTQSILIKPFDIATLAQAVASALDAPTTPIKVPARA